MGNNLYFICPTDHIESTINRTFTEKNYYCSSLGNSIVFDQGMMSQLRSMLKSRSIHKILFVLSDDNRFVLNAMRGKNSAVVTGLSEVYEEILSEKNTSELLWRKCDLQAVVIARLLQRKRDELQLKLEAASLGEVQLESKIYFRQQRTFCAVDSKISDRKPFNLN